jgi:hypothetical protein
MHVIPGSNDGQWALVPLGDRMYIYRFTVALSRLAEGAATEVGIL